MILEALKKFIYISLEFRHGILNRSMLDHLLINVSRNCLEEDILIGIGDLIVRVDVAKKVQKNARVTECTARNCGRKKAPLIILLLLKERIARNLTTVLVKEEMLP